MHADVFCNGFQYCTGVDICCLPVYVYDKLLLKLLHVSIVLCTKLT